MPFDPKTRLAAFYERHFDELVDVCLEVNLWEGTDYEIANTYTGFKS